MLTRIQIAALIPHQGSMCLLDGVERWDASSLTAHSSAHADPGHPLRRDGRLAGITSIEPGLQAMALHGALTGGGAQPPGLLTSLRDVTVSVEFLDELDSPLRIEVQQLAAEARGFLYHFAITAAGLPVSRGTAMIMLPAPSP